MTTTKDLMDLYGEKNWEIKSHVATECKSLYDALMYSTGPRNEPLYSLLVEQDFDSQAEFDFRRKEHEHETDDEIWVMVDESLNDSWQMMFDELHRARYSGDDAVLDASCLTMDDIKITAIVCDRATCGAMLEIDEVTPCQECHVAYCEYHMSEIGEECGGCDYVRTGLDAMRETLLAHGQEI